MCLTAIRVAHTSAYGVNQRVFLNLGSFLLHAGIVGILSTFIHLQSFMNEN